jgi:aspartate/methionine/tyrosine aminotransferase
MSEDIRLPELTISTLSKKSTITVVAGKARALELKNPDFVRADIGEVTAPGLFPPGYRESLEQSSKDVIKEGRIGYTVPDGDPNLRKLIFKHSIPYELRAFILEQAKDAREKMQNFVAITHGGSGALGVATSMFFEGPKRFVVINQRTWQNHNLIVDMHGGMLWPVPLINEKGQVADPDSILKLCQPVKDQISSILYTEINNPDGAAITEPAEQAKLEAIIKALNVPLILDVAYHEMAYDGKKVMQFSTDIIRRMVVCGTYSKTIQIPGERLGYISSADERVVRYVYFYNRSHSGCPSVTPQKALIAHLTKFDTAPDEIAAYRKALMSDLEARRNVLVSKVKEELGWNMSSPKGAIYAAVPVPPDVVKQFKDIDNLSVELVDKGGVSTVSGTDFEFRVRKTATGYECVTPPASDPEMNYLRFCFGFTPLDRVALAVSNMKKFIQGR